MAANAYILNCNFPMSMSFVDERVALGGRAWCVDELVMDAHDGEYLGLWTSPKWAKKGDVCFIMCAKSALSRVRRMVRERRDETASHSGLLEERVIDALGVSEMVCANLGGCIIGWARVVSEPVELHDDGAHWSNRVYVELDDWHEHDTGIPIAEFDGLVRLNSFGGITKLDDDASRVLLSEFNITFE